MQLPRASGLPCAMAPKDSYSRPVQRMLRALAHRIQAFLVVECGKPETTASAMTVCLLCLRAGGRQRDNHPAGRGEVHGPAMHVRPEGCRAMGYEIAPG